MPTIFTNAVNSSNINIVLFNTSLTPEEVYVEFPPLSASPPSIVLSFLPLVLLDCQRIATSSEEGCP